MEREAQFPTTAPVASPLRGRYLVRNPVANTVLRLVDGVLRLAVPARPRAPAAPPRRLLLSIGGHLGDAVVATRALVIARERFPGAEIGLLVASWVLPVLAGHPDAQWVHTFDHWKPNRGRGGKLGKLVRHWKTGRAATREIRAVGYDAAVDLYPHFPNASAILWRAGVPVRVGFASGGLGPLYTHALEWVDADRHFSDAFSDLLAVLPAGGAVRDPGVPRLPEPTAAVRRRVEEILDEASLNGRRFAVLHMGAGLALKTWPREKWEELTREIAARGFIPVFTGAGEAETTDARAVVERVGVGVSFCDALQWQEFVGVVARARLVVCTDSVAGHVASAAGVPCVTLMSGVIKAVHWRPLGDRSTVVTNPVPCSPCYRSRGCATMACMREIGIPAVLDAVDAALAPAPRTASVPAG